MLSLLTLGLFGGLALLMGAAVAVPALIVCGILWVVLLPFRLVWSLLGLALGPVFAALWWFLGLLLSVAAVAAVVVAVGAALGAAALGLSGAAVPALLIAFGLWVCYRAVNPRARAA